jgi:hypothetical protein
VRRQGALDGLDDVVAAVFAFQHQVVAEHCARTDVENDQQPEAVDLEFLFEAQGIAEHDLQSHIQSVTVELDDLVGPHGHRCTAAVLAGQAFEPLGAGGMGGSAEVAQHLGFHVGTQ